MTSKSHVHNRPAIKRLQNSLYGRLSRRRYSCAGGCRWFEPHQPELCGLYPNTFLDISGTCSFALRHLSRNSFIFSMCGRCTQIVESTNITSIRTGPSFKPPCCFNSRSFERAVYPCCAQISSFFANIGVVPSSSRISIPDEQHLAIRRRPRLNFSHRTESIGQNALSF